MQPDLQLAHAILESEPAAAARLLERQPAGAVAALFEDVPPRETAPVLARMLPARAAAVIARLTGDCARDCLLAMSSGNAAAILRPVAATARAGLLSALPAHRRAAVAALLEYREDTIGAWVDTRFFAASENATVAQVRSQLEGGARDEALVYVLDGGRRLVGTVSLPELFRAPAGTMHLASLMQTRTTALSGRTPLAAALGHPRFKRSDTLAVQGAKGEMIGVLRHHRLRTALGGYRERAVAGKSVLGEVTSAYGASLLALVRAFNLEPDAETES